MTGKSLPVGAQIVETFDLLARNAYPMPLCTSYFEAGRHDVLQKIGPKP